MASKFQQRHYEAIAEVIASTQSHFVSGIGLCIERDDLIRTLSDIFAIDNPHFKPDLFRQASEKGDN